MGCEARPVIEVFAAVIGAGVGVVGISTSSALTRRNADREAVIRLTAGVESIASKLEELHLDMREDRKHIHSRLNDHDIRIGQLEGKQRK